MSSADNGIEPCTLFKMYRVYPVSQGIKALTIEDDNEFKSVANNLYTSLFPTKQTLLFKSRDKISSLPSLMNLQLSYERLIHYISVVLHAVKFGMLPETSVEVLKNVISNLNTSTGETVKKEDVIPIIDGCKTIIECNTSRITERNEFMETIETKFETLVEMNVDKSTLAIQALYILSTSLPKHTNSRLGEAFTKGKTYVSAATTVFLNDAKKGFGQLRNAMTKHP